MPNIRLDIEYDGEPYHGWQRQLGLPTVQQYLEDTLAQVLGRKVSVYGAGRTDSGVHAAAQVANFYVEPSRSSIPDDRWGLMLNTKLPHTIRVVRSQAVDEAFHAQKSAVSKRYEYRILNRKFASALDRRVYFAPHHIDWEGMKAAAQYFVGTHDFRALQSGKNTLRSTTRTIFSFEVEESSVPGLYVLAVEGSGFLRQMVRNMVGTLLDVGEGRKPPEWIQTVLQSRDREFAGRSVPARGLCLIAVRYADG